MQFKVIKHSYIDDIQLNNIAIIKSVFGAYNMQSQLDWIDSNIGKDDFHVLAYDSEGNLMAYANFVHIMVNIDRVDKKALGVGNVCAACEGIGLGKELLLFLNEYLLRNDKIGLLFCKQKLESFYNKFHWKKVDINLKEPLDISFMIFDPRNELHLKNIVYNGKFF